MTSAKTICGRNLELSLLGFPCDMFLEPFEEHAYSRFIQTCLLYIVPDSVYPVSPSDIPFKIDSTTFELLFYFLMILFFLLHLFLIQVYRFTREVMLSLVLRVRPHFTAIALMLSLGISLVR